MAKSLIPPKALKLAFKAVHDCDNAAVWVVTTTEATDTYGDVITPETAITRSPTFYGWVGRVMEPDKFGDDSRLKEKEVRQLWYPRGSEVSRGAKLAILPLDQYDDPASQALWYEVIGPDEVFGLPIDGSVLIARNQAGAGVNV